MSARLGLGLIGTGRPWPAATSVVPSPAQTRELLQTAAELRIDVLDTAPAYGASERLLGESVRDPRAPDRSRPFLATKCGEYWSPERGSRTDHSAEAVETSVRASVALLGHVDLLQIHKATPAVVADDALLTLLTSLTGELGIPHLGVSAKDTETCDAALATGVFDHIQCPVNLDSPALAQWAAKHCGDITIVANRPYGSGRLLQAGHDPRELLSYVVDHVGAGVVLTGTTSAQHLRETHDIFSEIIGA